MQIAIEHLEGEMKSRGMLPNWDMYLDKEKEQIAVAYWASCKQGQYSGDKTAEEYYNQIKKHGK